VRCPFGRAQPGFLSLLFPFFLCLKAKNKDWICPFVHFAQIRRIGAGCIRTKARTNMDKRGHLDKTFCNGQNLTEHFCVDYPPESLVFTAFAVFWTNGQLDLDIL
jgi:hypothetical protein